MTGPSLLRRAAAATLGATRHPARTRTLTSARHLTLARRAAAATLGIRSYQHTRPAPGTSPTPARIWETRGRPAFHPPAPADTAPDAADEDDHPPRTAVLLEPRQGSALPRRPVEPTWLPPVIIDASGTATEQPRTHRGLALAAMAAVLAIAFAAFSHHIGPLSHHAPSSRVSSKAPTPKVTGGDVPQSYLGTWTGTLDNDTGHSTRVLVVSQGKIGEAELRVSADGPTKDGDMYHCVFAATLTASPSGDSRLHFGPSHVISGRSPACSAGRASTLSLQDAGTLRRTTDNSVESLIYTRAQ